MALPLYSRAEDLADMWRMRRRFARLQMTVVTPVLAIFVATASQLVPVIFGERWNDAVLPAQILVAVPLIGLIGTGTGPLLMAAGRPGTVAAANGANLALYAVVIALVAEQDLVTLSLVVVAFNAAFAFLSAYVLTYRVLGFSPLPLFEELAVALAAAVPTFALAFAIGELEPSFVTMLWSVAGTVVWCLVTYGAIVRFVFPDTWRDVAPVVRRFLRVPARFR
jgi:lipopolysaccharide exporter